MKVFIGNMSPIRVETKPLPKFEPVKPHIEPEPIMTHVEPIQIPAKKEQAPTVTKKENRKIRSVSFNLTVPAEIRLSKFSDKHTSFSTYVKKLIQRDMEAHQ